MRAFGRFAEVMKNRTLCIALLALSLGMLAVAPPNRPTANTLFAKGHFGAAYQAYKAEVSASPGSVSALLGLGTIELYRNQLDKAKHHLQRVLALDPANAIAKARLNALTDRVGSPQDYRIVDEPSVVRIPFVLDPLPVISVIIDGHPATMLVDTGAPGIGLSQAFVHRLGLHTTLAGHGVFAGGRTAGIQTTRVGKMVIGSLQIAGIPAQVFPGIPVDGIVGTGFLSHFLTTIDYAHKVLVLKPRAFAPIFEQRMKAAGAVSIPMLLVGDHFIFAKATVNSGETGWFNIDTGGPFGVQLTKASLAASHTVIDPKKAKVVMGPGGPTHIIPFTVANVALGRHVVRNVDGVYFLDGDQYGIFPFTVSGTLSQAYFDHSAITFDFAAMRMVIR